MGCPLSTILSELYIIQQFQTINTLNHKQYKPYIQVYFEVYLRCVVDTFILFQGSNRQNIIHSLNKIYNAIQFTHATQ